MLAGEQFIDHTGHLPRGQHAARRFTLGLGATTNLTDGFPWGLWVAFDVMCGVGLAGGGHGGARGHGGTGWRRRTRPPP